METIDRNNQPCIILQTTTIDFNEVKANDTILIRTRNSVYSFQIIDAAEKRGKLTGDGHFVASPEVVLVGTMPGPEYELCTERVTLKTGSRAVFLTDCRGEIEKLLTSTILGLVCLRNDSGGLTLPSGVACPRPSSRRFTRNSGGAFSYHNEG